MNQAWQDLRFAARLLWRSPGFTVVSAATLALGIAFVTLLFALADAFFLRALPFAEPGRLVHVWQTDTTIDADQLRVSVPNWEDWRRAESFEDLGGYYYTSYAGRVPAQVGASQRESGADGGTRTVQVLSTSMTPNLLAVLGVSPRVGRGFTAEDALPGAPPVVVLADRGWRRLFAAGRDDDPSEVLGRTVVLDGVDHTVVGVMREDFVFPFNSMELFEPLETSRFADQRGVDGPLLVIGRLRAGVRVAEAQAELDTTMARLAAAHPDTNATKGANIVDLRSAMLFTYDTFRVAFPALFLAVGFVLAIACANIGNLLLARAAGRGREIAFRLALGATRGRLLRQLATESLLLALAGGALGAALTLPLARVLERNLPLELYRVGPVAVDGRALLFAFCVACACSLAFGLLPALQATRPRLAEVLAEGGRGSSASRSPRRWGSALVVVQVALAVLLVTGAALMAKTFAALRGVELGFDADRLLTADLVLSAGKYTTPEARNRFFDTLVERLEAIPGVRSATAAYPLQLNHEEFATEIQVEGHEPPGSAGDEVISAATFWVMPGYFETLGIPLLEGRGFAAADGPDAVPVAMVNRRLAERFWPGQSAIGRRVLIGEEWRTIVGVAADSVVYGIDRDTPLLVYRPQSQVPTRRRFVFLRATGDPVALAGALADAVAEVDPEQPVVDVRPMSRVVWMWLGPWMMAIGGIGFLGLGALLLAAMGLYGVLSYSVSQRTRELGIRSALGAGRGDLMTLVLRDGLTLTAVGLVVGTTGALGLTRFLGSLLFGVGALDAGTFALVPVILVVVATIACWLPARRALRVDSIEALRRA
jgi:putative ABC transport system permease protein